MKNEKYKANYKAGIILILFGAVFGGTPLMLSFGSIKGNEDTKKLLVFVVIGLFIIALGIFSIVQHRKASKVINELIYRNEYIYADFSHIKQTLHETDDSRYYTYSAVFRFCDENGSVYEFKGDEYNHKSSVPFAPGDSAKVFVDLNKNPKIYMVSKNDTIHSDSAEFLRDSKADYNPFSSVLSIVVGAVFVLIPGFIGAKYFFSGFEKPVLIGLLLFFSIFIVVGIINIIKGIKELINRKYFD